MNRTLPLLATLSLALASLWASADSCVRAQRNLSRDLAQALALTADTPPADWLSPDTLRVFRSHLATSELRQHAYLCFSLADERPAHPAGAVSGGTLVVGKDVRACAYATCSLPAVWRMSDQRTAALLALAALLTALSMAAPRTRRNSPIAEEATPEEPAADVLVLTPMQQQLMDLLLASPTRERTRQELCDALWPRKDNAAETLYTLVHRLKPVLEQHSPWRIVAVRGRSYRLERRTATHEAQSLPAGTHGGRTASGTTPYHTRS